ncbi:lambda-crystallin-like isoform X1 [Amphiura filiformis]|uniref:lambda-crystallin-like isoform X1 n=2 Tax=Amphiura filiformis TaxID=82378 RepID=UPI003B22257F
MASNGDMHKNNKIAIVGSGLIGRSWAMIFASAGYQVTLYDILPSQVSTALENIKGRLDDLKKAGQLRGSLSPEEQFNLITGTNDLKEAIQGAGFVQECVPEVLELKRKVFKQMEEFAGDETILSSSSSCITPSEITETLQRRKQCVVSHPVSPPYYAPLVEIIPAPWTDQAVVDKTRALMEEVGQVPETLRRELPGFALNRMQYALINESWRLVQDGLLSCADVDKVMWAGMGMRYAFIGPFEVMHLNAEGMASYLERYSKTIQNVSGDFGPNPTFDGEGYKQIVKEMDELIPLDQLEERRKARDARMAALAKLKHDMDGHEKTD